MDLLEHQGKRLLAGAGLTVPDGAVAATADDAYAIAARLAAPVMIKAQVPSGRRGKAGAILPAATPDEARAAAARLLGADLAGATCAEVLVERRIEITAELYAAVLNDPETKGPLALCSTAGGMEVEEASGGAPDGMARLPVDIRTGLTQEAAEGLAARAGIAAADRAAVGAALVALYGAYRANDAELAEVNPLALTPGGPVALDAKITIDPGAVPRHPDLPAPAPYGTDLEREARAAGLVYIELDGEVGVLANGAGLTMQTLDAVNHHGGRPANFCEIGGDAYTKAVPALRVVLGNPRVRSLLVNFCGAFARTDVMAGGVVAALEELRPDVPVFFTIHGTGEDDAIALVRDRLGLDPYDDMGAAVAAAVNACAEVR
ncbi:MAG TPA: ATP-grasp domain-containing protein [Streptosporangiaceae bacterium]|jgi:succinyl-CoA synthetase beta subunit